MMLHLSMHRTPFRPGLRGRAFALALGALATISTAAAQTKPAGPQSLSIDDAARAALAHDPGVESAHLDWLSAGAKADSATWKQLPSLSASAGYQRLSDLQSSISLGGGAPPISFGSLDNIYSFGLNLQYQLFTGSRVKESIAIAALQAQVKDVAQETLKRSLLFDVRRAYWEAVRATYNRATLEQNLALMKENSGLVTRQLGEGVATRADQLSAQMRLEQATEDLGDAEAQQARACLSLLSLTGQDISTMGISTAAPGAPLPLVLTSRPEDAVLPDASAPPDEAALVSAALARRPETRTAQLARMLAEHSVALSRAALYPTVAVTGNYTYADPNQRVVFQSDPGLFTGTWAVGLQLTYDIGGLPSALDDVKSQTYAASKARADESRQRQSVVLDVEACIVNLARTMRDLSATQAMVAQAQENLRVVQGRIEAGTAKDVDLSTAKFDLLRVNFSVTNRRIDALIAQADLARATASEDVE